MDLQGARRYEKFHRRIGRVVGALVSSAQPNSQALRTSASTNFRFYPSEHIITCYGLELLARIACLPGMRLDTSGGWLYGGSGAQRFTGSSRAFREDIVSVGT